MAEEIKRHYPVFLDLEGRFVVVIGSDRLSHKRALGLSKAGAQVTVIGADPCQELWDLQHASLIDMDARPYVRGDLRGAFLTFCTSDDPEVGKAVFAEADGNGALVNVHGRPEWSNFVVPGAVRRGALQIAVSTGGLAPSAARVVRREIKRHIDDAWGEWVALLGRVHALALQELSAEEVAPVMERVAQADLVERLRAGEDLTAEKVLDEFRPGTGGAEAAPEATGTDEAPQEAEASTD